jgi:DNA-directed RNA polymerase subunit RPC12/RpoP
MVKEARCRVCKKLFVPEEKIHPKVGPMCPECGAKGAAKAAEMWKFVRLY